MRKNAKNLRYASEFFGSLFDDKDGKRRHKRFVNALEHLPNELGTLNEHAMVPLVIEKIDLGDNLTAQLQLLSSKKADLLIAASDAHDKLLDAKRFWA